MADGVGTDPLEYEHRLAFLYKVVDDTQNTIRFIDTKAAFCVTLLSGMVAGSLQGGHSGSRLHQILFLVFMASVGLSLLVCLRVIFPTIKPHGVHAAARGPKFFIAQNKRRHWLMHTVKNSVEVDAMSESHESYMDSVLRSSDLDLISAMCDEVLSISLIRQIKSDRLHAAMFSLVGTVSLFIAMMLVK